MSNNFKYVRCMTSSILNHHISFLLFPVWPGNRLIFSIGYQYLSHLATAFQNQACLIFNGYLPSMVVPCLGMVCITITEYMSLMRLLRVEFYFFTVLEARNSKKALVS